MHTLLLTVLLLMTAVSVEAAPRDEIAGPVEALVLRVIDGDTLLVEARPWPQQKIEVYVRIRGIDTPEIRSKCPQIREAALAARRTLQELAERSETIRLSRISGDKYFGRVVADVVLSDDIRAADHLLLAGLAQDYDGGHKAGWPCPGP